MSKTKVIYYISPSGENPIDKFLDSLIGRDQAKILRVFAYIREYGLIAPLPHVKKLTGTPLWEVRILGRNNIRVLYVSPAKNTVLILHGFIKKSAKTPQREIGTALSRYREMQKR